MSIYSRDNIAYNTQIDNMIKNRLNTMQRNSDRIQKEADIASDTAKSLASTFARGMDYAQYESEQNALKNKLKELEDRRDYIRSQYVNSADYKPYSESDAYKSEQAMQGYVPSYNTTEVIKYKTSPATYVIDDAKSKWLQAHPDMTEEDYDKFVEYQNSIYGGR